MQDPVQLQNLDPEQMAQMISQLQDRLQQREERLAAEADLVNLADGEDDEENSTEINIANATENLRENPTQFPHAATDKFFFKDDQDRNIGECDIINSFEDVLQFPNHPSFQIKTDVDSIYAVDRSLPELFSAFKNKISFTMESWIKPYKKMWSSRFFVDTTSMVTPPQMSFASRSKVPMNLYPSIRLGVLSIGLERPMDVYLVNTATSRIYKNHMFNQQEIAVITAAMNMSRSLCKSCCTNSRSKRYMAKDFIECAAFKSYYGSKSTKTATTEYNNLQGQQTKMFAKYFHKALDKIASSDWEEDYSDKELVGVVDDTKKFKADKLQMQLFAQELKRGCQFVMTISGIKKEFNMKEFQTYFECPANFLEPLQTILDNNMEQAVEELNSLLEEENECSKEDFPEYDIIPYAMNEEEGTLVTLQDIDKELPMYATHFEKPWKDLIHSGFNAEIARLSKGLDEWLKELFGIKNRFLSIFFDIGVEVRLVGNHSLLLDVDKLMPYLKTQAQQR